MKTHKGIKKVHVVAISICNLLITTIGLTSFNYSIKDEVKKWRWEEMRPDDMREVLETTPVAWVVFSPLEWHGEAMAFGTDPIIGQAVIDKVWERVGGVRIPTILTGVETDYKYWGEKGLMSHWGMELITEEHNIGSIYARPVTFQLVVEDYFYFLKREKFKLVIVSSGHGGREHLEILKELCEKYSDDDTKIVFVPIWGGAELPEELLFSAPKGHANVKEASLLGAINPKLVDKSKFGVTEQDRKAKLKKENANQIDFEKGKKLIDFQIDFLEKKVRELLKEIK